MVPSFGLGLACEPAWVANAPLCSLVEGRLHDDCLDRAAPAVDLELGTDRRQVDGEVAAADVLSHRGPRAAAGPHADLHSLLVVERVAVSRDAPAGHLEADEPPGLAVGLDPGERLAPDEVPLAEL